MGDVGVLERLFCLVAVRRRKVFFKKNIKKNWGEERKEPVMGTSMNSIYIYIYFFPVYICLSDHHIQEKKGKRKIEKRKKEEEKKGGFFFGTNFYSQDCFFNLPFYFMVLIYITFFFWNTFLLIFSPFILAAFTYFP